MHKGRSHTCERRKKIDRGILGMKGPSPSPGFQYQVEKSPYFWLLKLAGIEAVEDRNC